MIDIPDLLTAMFVSATVLVYAAAGEVVTERAGVLNLGIEGTMYSGAFVGFTVADHTGSPWIGLAAAIAAGLVAAALMGLLTVTLGVNQHVSGIGTTLLLIAACDFSNRLLYGGGQLVQVKTFPQLFEDTPVASQYLLTYVAFLGVLPLLAWLLTRTGFGLRIRAVGENPEAADVAGLNVARTRYSALLIGGALMAVGGAFLTLAMVGTFTLNITSGRGWVAIALVIFGRWRIWGAVAGALLFAGIDALQLQLAITETFAHVPREVMIAMPYVVVIAALAASGRNVAYPGAYLKPYRRV